MRLIFIKLIFCGTLLNIADEIRAQSGETVSLKSAIEILEERYEVIFSYLDKAIEGRTVSSIIPEGDQFQVVSFVVGQTPLKFKLVGKRMFILYEPIQPETVNAVDERSIQRFNEKEKKI